MIAYSAWKESVFRIFFLSFAIGEGAYHLVVSWKNLPYFYTHEWIYAFLVAPSGVLAAMLVGIIIHEGSHAGMAALLGGRVYRVQIGSGPLLLFCKVGKTPWQFHSSLLSGAVFYGLSTPRRARLKIAVVTAAAPLSSAVLFFGSLILLLAALDNEAMIYHWPYLLGALIGWTAGTLIYLPGTLLPFRYKWAGRTMKTDMLKLLTLPWMKDEAIAKMNAFARTSEWMEPGIISQEEARNRYEAEPDNCRILLTYIQFLRTAKDPQTLALAEKLLSLRAATPVERTLYLDNYLTTCLDLNAISTSNADHLSAELLEINPNDLSVIGTRGAVLVDLGRFDEGVALLIKTLSSSEKLVQAYGHVFLAIAERQRGNLEQAARHAEEAAILDSSCQALERIRDLLPADVSHPE